MLGGLLVVVLATAALLLVRAGGGPSPRSSDPTAVATVEPAREPTPALDLRWRPVRGAFFYNVIFWRDGVRELDLWPEVASVRVAKDRLEPGSYQWFVYPMLGNGGSRRYGKVIASGDVRI